MNRLPKAREIDRGDEINRHEKIDGSDSPDWMIGYGESWLPYLIRAPKLSIHSTANLRIQTRCPPLGGLCHATPGRAHPNHMQKHQVEERPRKPTLSMQKFLGPRLALPLRGDTALPKQESI